MPIRRPQATVKVTALFLIALLVAPGWLSAAIVNIESERFEEPPEGLSGVLKLSIAGESGNQQSLSTAAGIRMDHVTEDRQWITLASKRYGRSSGEVDVDESFLHLRRVQPLSSTQAWEGFVQGEQNPFRLLEWRSLVGAGFRWGPYGAVGNVQGEESSGDSRHYLGLGAFMEWERREPPEGSQHSETLRLNSYWNFRYRTETGVELSQTLYLQPAMDNADDYRILNQFAAVSPITQRMELQLGVTLRYDSRPPAEVKRLDSTYDLALRWRFDG